MNETLLSSSSNFYEESMLTSLSSSDCCSDYMSAMTSTYSNSVVMPTAAMAMSSAATAVTMTPTITPDPAKFNCTDLPDLLLDLSNVNIDHIGCLLQPGPFQLYIVWPLVAGVLLAILLCLCICCCGCMQILKKRKGFSNDTRISNGEFRNTFCWQCHRILYMCFIK